MKWSVIQLQKFRDKGLQIDEMVDLPELKKRDPQIRHIDPVHVTGRGDISSEKVTFHLRLEGEMILPCSRTLKDVPYPFDVQTTETFLLKSSSYSEYEEEEVHQVQGDVIDLKPIMEEILLLEVPLQVFCEDADDDFSFSGKGWELQDDDSGSQGETEEKLDPRMAELAKFFDQNKE
ncbi:MAG TPA: YceD family protein [Chondromyces sp.]|nr:YceD family protein [Chondromyces sp.]